MNEVFTELSTALNEALTPADDVDIPISVELPLAPPLPAPAARPRTPPRRVVVPPRSAMIATPAETGFRPPHAVSRSSYVVCESGWRSGREGFRRGGTMAQGLGPGFYAFCIALAAAIAIAAQVGRSVLDMEEAPPVRTAMRDVASDGTPARR